MRARDWRLNPSLGADPLVRPVALNGPRRRGSRSPDTANLALKWANLAIKLAIFFQIQDLISRCRYTPLARRWPHLLIHRLFDDIVRRLLAISCFWARGGRYTPVRGAAEHPSPHNQTSFLQVCLVLVLLGRLVGSFSTSISRNLDEDVWPVGRNFSPPRPAAM